LNDEPAAGALQMRWRVVTSEGRRAGLNVQHSTSNVLRREPDDDPRRFPQALFAEVSMRVSACSFVVSSDRTRDRERPVSAQAPAI